MINDYDFFHSASGSKLECWMECAGEGNKERVDNYLDIIMTIYFIHPRHPAPRSTWIALTPMNSSGRSAPPHPPLQNEDLPPPSPRSSWSHARPAPTGAGTMLQSAGPAVPERRGP